MLSRLIVLGIGQSIHESFTNLSIHDCGGRLHEGRAGGGDIGERRAWRDRSLIRGVKAHGPLIFLRPIEILSDHSNQTEELSATGSRSSALTCMCMHVKTPLKSDLTDAQQETFCTGGRAET